MALRVEIRQSVRGKIAAWGLSDAVLVDVYLFLREILPSQPGMRASTGELSLLRRVRVPFDGLVFEFSLIDPRNRLREHFFFFLVAFSQDEEALIVCNAAYTRREGMG